MTSDTPSDADASPRRDVVSARPGTKPKRAGIIVSDTPDDFAVRRHDVFFAAVEMTRMPMTVTDPRQPDNPIVFANQAFLNMTGYRADEIIGSNCRFLQGPETDRATLAELRRAIAERREHATEILNYRKDGYNFWNALFVSPIFDEAGELIYFFGSQLDVTRRREAEDALRQAQKMEALGRLTGGIAHDFNNLLQVMIGYLELIDNGLKKPEINIPKLQRSIGNARDAADRASSLTQQLLAFSRKQRVESRTINLNDIVASIMELADRTLGDDVTIETNLAAGLSDCRVDAAQAEVALLNMLINASDAMATAAIKRVTIETKDVIVHREDMTQHQNVAPGHYCTVAVSDSGAGMPPALLERVMDPFFTTKEESKGTGLGLSMVYGFAKQTGGLARISSVESGGTTMRIYFPAVEAMEAAAAKRAPQGRALDRPGDETILMVEARPDVAALARMILEDLGYTVLHALDAAQALDILETHQAIHLLFSDLIMRGDTNGVALAREAKRRRPDLKVLLTTGYAEASLERTDAGGSEFDVLNKPYGRSELARKVRVVLDGPTGVS